VVGILFYLQDGEWLFGKVLFLRVHGLVVCIKLIEFSIFTFKITKVSKLGLRERHNHHFESGISCFPYDFPSTKSFEKFSNEQKKIAQLEYDARPPAKRPNFKKLQVDSPFEPPFYQLVGIETKETHEKNSIDINEEPKEQIAWLLQGIKHIQLLEKFENSSDEFNQALFTQIMQAFDARGITLESGNVSFDLNKALVHVRVEFLARGIPGPNAIIYKADKNKYDYWINVLKNRKNDSNSIGIESDQDDAEKVINALYYYHGFERI
jgi:ribonuclease P/MRP protein subunit POP1